jgi:hypothetical protein
LPGEAIWFTRQVGIGEPKRKCQVISFVESGELGAIIFVVRVFLAMEKAKPLRFANEGIGGQ